MVNTLISWHSVVIITGALGARLLKKGGIVAGAWGQDKRGCNRINGLKELSWGMGE